MKKYLLLPLLLCIVFVACTNTPRQLSADKIIDIKAALQNPTEDLSQFVDSSWFVVLSAPIENIQGYITKAVAHGHKIYCLDELQSRTLNVYDSLGHFLYQLARRGKGPTEALNITDFSIHGDEVFVTDILQNRIQVYNTSNGEHVRTLKLPFSAYEFYKVSNNRYLFVLSPYNEDAGADYLSNEVLITDSLLAPVRFQVKRPITDRGTVSRSPWNAMCGNNHLFSIFNESLYQYDPATDSMVCTTGFDYGSDNVSEEVAQNYRSFMNYYSGGNRMRLSTESPLVVGSYIIGQVIDGDSKYLMIHDGSKTFTKRLSLEGYDVMEPLLPIGLANNQNTLISYVEPSIGIQQLRDRRIPVKGHTTLVPEEYPMVLLFSKLK